LFSKVPLLPNRSVVVVQKAFPVELYTSG